MASPRRRPEIIHDAHLSFYCWLLQVVFLISAISILIWKCLTPEPPVFTVTIDGASLDHHQPFSDGNLTSSVAFNIEISNPNQGYGVYFISNILISLDGSSIVGNGSISEFYYLGLGDTVSLNGTMTKTRTTRKIGSCLDDDDDGDVVGLRLRTGVVFEDKVIGRRTKLKEMDYGADLRVGLDGNILGGKQVIITLLRNHHKVASRGVGHACMKSSRKFLSRSDISEIGKKL